MVEPHKYPFSTLTELSDEQRAALERELVPSARAAAVGDLAADIGHDLANPLFAVIALVDLLLLDATLAAGVVERLELVKETSLGLKESLRALTIFVRPAEGHESASLDDAVRLAVSLVRRGRAKELAVTASYPGEPVVVHCPAGLLTQAALHVLAAGRAAAGDTGAVEVEVSAGGALRVGPAAPDGLGVLAAGRIALDHGGELTREGEGLVLRLPLWTSS